MAPNVATRLSVVNARTLLAVGVLAAAGTACGTALASDHHQRAATLRPCTSSQLHVSLGGGAGAGMSQLRTGVQLRNISRSTCTLYGYPGVSWVSPHAGHQVGPAAVRSMAVHPRRVTVAPNRMASAPLDIVEGDGGLSTRQCRPRPVAGLRIYPPGQRTALLLPVKYEGVGVCTSARLSTLSVGPLRRGAIPG